MSPDVPLLTRDGEPPTTDHPPLTRVGVTGYYRSPGSAEGLSVLSVGYNLVCVS